AHETVQLVGPRLDALVAGLRGNIDHVRDRQLVPAQRARVEADAEGRRGRLEGLACGGVRARKGGCRRGSGEGRAGLEESPPYRTEFHTNLRVEGNLVVPFQSVEGHYCLREAPGSRGAKS